MLILFSFKTVLMRNRWPALGFYKRIVLNFRSAGQEVMPELVFWVLLELYFAALLPDLQVKENLQLKLT